MVANFLKFLAYEKRYSNHTIAAYKRDLEQFGQFVEVTFEITQAKDILHPHLRSWIVQLMDEGIKPKSINRKIATLKSYFKFLQAREAITQNPAVRLKPLKTDKMLPAFVQEAEMTKLLDHLEFPSGFVGSRDKLIIELFYATGIRLAELIGLKESDINVYDQTIKVLGKRDKERVIPIPQGILESIRHYRHEKEVLLGNKRNSRLLVTEKGDELYPMIVYRLIKKYLGLVTTLSKKSPHVLRHTFATHMLDKGAELNAVKDLLGHTSLAATQVYTHNSLEKLKSTFDQAHPRA